jgi:hypothetical protein
VRISGVYPPPLRPIADDDLARLAEPRVTRYDRRGRRAPRPAASWAWAGTSLLLAVAGVGLIALPALGSRAPARLAVPAAVVAPPSVASPALPALVATDAPAPLVLPPSAPRRVQIPALGVTSKVMELGLELDGSMEVPPAGYPVGWYDRGPTPGELGPAVLAGHVDWAGKPGAFYGLRELLAGDAIVVERSDGTVATFRVDRVEGHAKEAFPIDEVYGDIDHAGLRLITCGGSFDEDTGDYAYNIVVFASLETTG